MPVCVMGHVVAGAIGLLLGAGLLMVVALVATDEATRLERRNEDGPWAARRAGL